MAAAGSKRGAANAINEAADLDTELIDRFFNGSPTRDDVHTPQASRIRSRS
jgi:hypothetical protein